MPQDAPKKGSGGCPSSLPLSAVAKTNDTATCHMPHASVGWAQICGHCLAICCAQLDSAQLSSPRSCSGSVRLRLRLRPLALRRRSLVRPGAPKVLLSITIRRHVCRFVCLRLPTVSVSFSCSTPPPVSTRIYSSVCLHNLR